LIQDAELILLAGWLNKEKGGAIKLGPRVPNLGIRLQCGGKSEKLPVIVVVDIPCLALWPGPDPQPGCIYVSIFQPVGFQGRLCV
jgi:hypothetical protein